jgi:hypothetical protein
MDARQERGRWLVPPPVQRELTLVIGIPPGATLAPELRRSLEAIAEALQREEVQARLRRDECTLINCQPLSCPDLTMCMPVVAPPPPPPPPPTCPSLA